MVYVNQYITELKSALIMNQARITIVKYPFYSEGSETFCGKRFGKNTKF